MHEHPEKAPCVHELQHCAHCDVVFCPKCKREWKAAPAFNTNEWMRRIQLDNDKAEPRIQPLPAPWIYPRPLAPQTPEPWKPSITWASTWAQQHDPAHKHGGNS